MRGLDVDGTEFRLVLGDGSVLPRDKLIGATLAFTNARGQAIRFRIDGIEADAKDRDGDILLYRLTAPDDSGNWRDMCSFDPDGRSLGFPIAGTWDDEGNPVAGAPGAFTIACTSGALGKCVRFGYKPWKSIAGTRLDRHHAACICMVRADYGGSGTSFTLDGQRIDIYDDFGAQTPDNDAGDTFEAGWSAAGAVCVHHPRVKANATLEELERRFPQLKGRTGAVCTEEFARARGALIFNRSRP